MNIKYATEHYEAWLATHTQLRLDDLALKHTRMAQAKDDGAFQFFRATFYRWAQLWPAQCPDLLRAPTVLAVGDLHVENFGTWRDAEGGLVWGVNDLDEAYMIPYTSDLVRLATSAALAIRAYKLEITSQASCERLLSGYRDGLRAGGGPCIVDEQHGWLLALAVDNAHKREQAWQAVLALPTVQAPIPASAVQVLERLLPQPNLPYRIVRRDAGIGSLGRQRWTAIAEWHGEEIVREVKALVPSAWEWANRLATPETLIGVLLRGAVRSADPFVRIEEGWITRRLALDTQRINVSRLAKKDLERLLYLMGWETANIHLGSSSAIDAVRHDVETRGTAWLQDAVQRMINVVSADWKAWRRDSVNKKG